MAIDTVRRGPPRPTGPTIPRRTPRRRRPGLWLLAGAGLLLAAAAGAIVAWSGASLASDPTALARVDVGPLGGTLQSVHALGSDGRPVPISLKNGLITPQAGLVAPGEHVSVQVVVRRPGALSWLLGSTRRDTLVLTAPAAHLTDPRITAQRGSSLGVKFDRPVYSVAYGAPVASAHQVLPRAETAVVIPAGAAAGTMEVAAAARSWERVGSPEQLTWFPASSLPAVVASPAPGAKVTPTAPIRLEFSTTVNQALGSAQPKLSPAVPGSWKQTGDYTLTFTPTGPGAALGTNLQVSLPRPVALVGSDGTVNQTNNVGWSVPPGSMLRLQQLLAQAGYLPVAWSPSGPDVARNQAAEVGAAVQPPAGNFTWRYPNVPPELRALWQPGHDNAITRGAVMVLESKHGLTADGVSGRRVWAALLADTIAGKTTQAGYSYVYVHRDESPQSATLWHNGRTIISSPANTGVAAAPTVLGTFPVFEHLAVTTMTGTNPGGGTYSDPGIRWVSYFNGGDALHAFDRASFGTPQSVGCVELPLASAAEIWPYTPIGTLVTIEH